MSILLGGVNFLLMVHVPADIPATLEIVML